MKEKKNRRKFEHNPPRPSHSVYVCISGVHVCICSVYICVCVHHSACMYVCDV